MAKDIELLRRFVHGDEETTVPLGKDGEQIDTNSLRRFIALAENLLDAAIKHAEEDLSGVAEQARKWAENPEDEPVEPGEFSALHWAAQAAKSAERAGQGGAVDIGPHNADPAAHRNIKFGPPQAPDDVVRLGDVGYPTGGFSGSFLDIVQSGKLIPGVEYFLSSSTISGLPEDNSGFFAKVFAVGTTLHIWARTYPMGGGAVFVNRYTPTGGLNGWRRIDFGGAFPSGQSINLAVPAAKGKATAPDNGWMTFEATANAVGLMAYMVGGGVGSGEVSSIATPQILRGCIPVSKGKDVAVDYSASTTNRKLSFIKSIGAV
jgi:hypothetical protein